VRAIRARQPLTVCYIKSTALLANCAGQARRAKRAYEAWFFDVEAVTEASFDQCLDHHRPCER